MRTQQDRLNQALEQMWICSVNTELVGVAGERRAARYTTVGYTTGTQG
jgi:hypothetical protein